MRSIFIGVLLAMFTVVPVKAEQVWVTIDQVRNYSISGEADSIIVGNPGIADIAVRDKNNFLLFGKSPGMTNLIILDSNGKVVKNLQVRVNSPNQGMLVFHRGSARTTFNCTDACQATLTVGDSVQQFNDLNAQLNIKTRQQQAGEEPEDLQTNNGNVSF